ncbi:ATP-binding protein [Bergeyella zoohelcum]|uniref:ATP-binding protein n=1 Tax=Bergeyella zoohelcum TaxID=1015 RepID=UPI002A90E526|nr:ATP-binding protein [Bergeyella zoohelcum]MDY6026471.1 ATP-binding protein [Bergeyella zoohelcum]
MENQNIEYKEGWRDEYIKWICGFANSKGGDMFIGVDDKGNVVGIQNAKKLSEDLPNKIKDILGILVDIDILEEKEKTYIKINVDAYPYPVSYKGNYYIRIGATNQELKGASLDKFLLQKQGLKWDGTPEPYTKLENLSEQSFDIFKNRASETQRVDENIQKYSNDEVLDKLNLYMPNGMLKKAAVLLFHPRPDKIFTGASIKIGFFRTDDDLAYQDEILGSLFEQVDKVMDLLQTKYLSAKIEYQGLQRKETLPIPIEALREAVLNAIIHKDYSSGIPIQISVYDNKLMIWNEGELPQDWTVAKLKIKHPSRPYNPDIANAFFRAGLIESWGRGTIKIINEMRKAQLPAPNFKYDDSGFYIIFSFGKVDLEKQILDLISENTKITVVKLAEILETNDKKIKRTLKELQDKKLLERIGTNRSGEWKIL